MAPCIWAPVADGGDRDALVARPFGAAISDILVDFAGPLNPTIDALLRLCLARPDGTGFAADELADWTLAKRRQGLLAIAVASNGPRRSVGATCPAAACGERLDLDLDLTALRQDWRREWVPFAGGRLRLPGPTDLAALGDRDPSRLAALLFEGDPAVCDGREADAEAALSAADPLGDLELRAACPSCAAPVALALTLEHFLVDELSRTASGLLDEVHMLAFAYHWTEPEIMALPESRRRHYLARIEQAWAA